MRRKHWLHTIIHSLYTCKLVCTCTHTHIHTHTYTPAHTHVPVSPAASAITNVEYERIMNMEVSSRGCSRNLDIFITKAVIIAMTTPSRKEPMKIPKNFKMEMKTDSTYSSGLLVPASACAAGSYSSTALLTGDK